MTSPTKRRSSSPATSSSSPSPSKRAYHNDLDPDGLGHASPALSSSSCGSSVLDASHDTEHILHPHVCTHLAKLYPAAPDDVLYFVATRLLSRDIPHGHAGDWAPLRFEDGPALVRGALDARVRGMYDVAYASYVQLVMECPDHEHKL